MSNVDVGKLFVLNWNGSRECFVLIIYCCSRRIILHARFWGSSSAYSLLSIRVGIFIDAYRDYGFV